MGAFGEKLRKQREQRGIELDAISNTTKISTRMLRALEDEHFDQLPGGVFNKGFVRAYARQIGLDEEEAVADYLAALRDSQLPQPSVPPDVRSGSAKSVPVSAPEPGDNFRSNVDVATDNNDGGDNHARAHQLRREDRRKHGRRNEDRLRGNKYQKYPAGDPAQPADESSAHVSWGKLALTLVLVTLVLAFWNFHRQAQPAPTSQTVHFSNQSPAPAPASAATAGIRSPEKSPATISVAPAPPHPEPASPAASATGSAPKSAAPPDAGLPAAKTTAPAPAAKPPSSFTLLIRAEKTTWVALTVDGKPVAQETLIAPAHTSIRATREIVVKAGNAAGISFLLNGKEIPAQGNEGEVKTYIFDATGLRTAPQ